MKKELNWNAFSPTGRREWEQAAKRALKGADPSVDLKRRLPGGMEVDAYKDQTDVSPNTGIPGKAPWKRGMHREGNDWSIIQAFGQGREELSNAKVLKVLNEGVSGLDLYLIPGQLPELKHLLKGVLIEILDVRLLVTEGQQATLHAFEELIDRESATAQNLRAAVLCDAFAQAENEEDSTHISGLLSECVAASLQAAVFPGVVRTVHVDVRYAANSAVGCDTELALALSKGHEYLTALLTGGLSADQAGALFQFSFGCGPDYFAELAKFRAFRRLWHQVIAAYGTEHSCSSGAYIHAETARWNKSHNDRYNNLLRSTTESMSAILGGVNSLSVLPFDCSSSVKEELAERWARNIQFILRDESFFHKVSDPAGGSWFIESLTEQLEDSAWKKFQEIEALGGYAAALKSGQVHRELKSKAMNLKQEMKEGRTSWIGVNKYAPQQAETSGIVDMNGVLSGMELDIIRNKMKEQ